MENSRANFISYIKRLDKLSFISFLLFLLDPFLLGYLFGYVFVFSLVIRNKIVVEYIDRGFFILLFFSVVYALFYALDPIGGYTYVINYALIPPFAYLFGKYMIKRSVNEDQIISLLIFIGFVYSFTALVSVFIEVVNNGFGSIQRSLPMFWRGNIVSATKMGGYFTLNLCLPGILLAAYKKFKTSKLVPLIALYIISLLCIVRLGSRTQLAVTVLTTVFTMIYLLWRESLKKNLGILGVFTILVAYLLSKVNFKSNAEWLSAYASRIENKGDLRSAGGRTDRWLLALENLIEKPLGWKVEEFGYAHNLWLDSAMVGGVLSFILLLIFTIFSFRTFKKYFKKYSQGIVINILFLNYGIAFLLVFFVEPILIGFFHLFCLFCFIVGCAKAYKLESNYSYS